MRADVRRVHALEVPCAARSRAPRSCRAPGGTVIGALCWAALGCGPSYPESEYPPAPPPGVSVAAPDLSPAPPGAIWRRDVNAVVDEGLGKFLQRVDVRPEIDQGAFVGFRIVELHSPTWWQGIDLVPGDVVTKINGMPIEQPTEAHAAFESLRTAEKLTVSYLRDGKPRTLEYTILEKPAPSPASP